MRYVWVEIISLTEEEVGNAVRKCNVVDTLNWGAVNLTLPLGKFGEVIFIVGIGLDFAIILSAPHRDVFTCESCARKNIVSEEPKSLPSKVKLKLAVF